jgi:hypothetical protein
MISLAFGHFFLFLPSYTQSTEEENALPEFFEQKASHNASNYRADQVLNSESDFVSKKRF